MKYNKIKKEFFSFFKKKNHKIYKSYPIINKDNSKLFFINSGINQFKKFFLGKKKIKYTKIANIQKCIRITGKHNDLKSVGKDNYHHTLFEMLGNWSIGNYDIKKAIKYAWILLTKIYKICKKRIYVTIFKGNKNYKLKKDIETYKYWKKFVNKKHILFFGLKENFWKIDNFKLCGPCTEIHVDIRNNKSKNINNKKGYKLINKNNKYVIELWNIVNIKYLIKNNKIYKNNNLLSNNFIDTGMGIERLSMILQKKQSTYDTDIFKKIIKRIEEILNIKYKINKNHDFLIKLLSDHIRSIFIIFYNNIAPNNKKYGYILRKLIRRCLIFVYKILNINTPFLFKLIKIVYKNFYKKIILKKLIIIENKLKKEEIFFYKNIKDNIKLMDSYLKQEKNILKNKYIKKKTILYIYSTYGIPFFIIKNYAHKHNLKIENIKNFI
ncbi:MAG: alanine--tRNA ligase-related protein [Candidatus Shikimatogenerans bostrichidophilus]|nr:MAG: alanine--tRNA ligase-related protein [Candidatus Shikimatogenerans bostrichidophilus]